MPPPTPSPTSPNDGSTAGPGKSAPTDSADTRAAGEPTTGAASTGNDLPLPVVVGGRYRLESLRGGGGMAKVYRGVDVTLEREVAVKLINPELRSDAEFDARFQREARIASQLSDPHIVVVHDFGIDHVHGPFLVMEYLQGLSLRERLNAEGPLPLKAGLQLAGQLLLALIHAHDKGIVHRDIKPDNVFLLNQSGVRLHTRILDFGIARIYREEHADQTAITTVGAVLGTPRYMAPEQLAGMPADARTDLYAAALVIFEAITGQLPYVQFKKLTELCPEATPQLQELLEHCLKQSPADRPGSAIEVYLRLTELGKASGVLLLPPGALTRLVAARQANDSTVTYSTGQTGTLRQRRKWHLLGFGGLVLLALAFLGGWLFFNDGAVASGPDSLLGVHIGDTTEQVEPVLPLTAIDQGNPWNRPLTRDHMGRVLTPDDLGLEKGDLARITTRWTANHQTLVLFSKDQVVAVVTKMPQAACKRGIHIGSKAAAVLSNYDDQQAAVKDIPLPAGGHVEVRRYDGPGIGFEIKSLKVTGMALYPPRQP